MLPFLWAFLSPSIPKQNHQNWKTSYRNQTGEVQNKVIYKNNWYFRISIRTSSHAHKMCLFNPGVSEQMLRAMGSISPSLCAQLPLLSMEVSRGACLHAMLQHLPTTGTRKWGTHSIRNQPWNGDLSCFHGEDGTFFLTSDIYWISGYFSI